MYENSVTCVSVLAVPTRADILALKSLVSMLVIEIINIIMLHVDVVFVTFSVLRLFLVHCDGDRKCIIAVNNWTLLIGHINDD